MREESSRTGAGFPDRVLLLSPLSRAEVVRHAVRAWPQECCGFLVGSRGSPRRVERVVPLENRAAHRLPPAYEIDPLDWMRVERQLEPRLEVVGVYHSHPDAACRPSRRDREGAVPGLSYLIVSLHANGTREMRSWEFDEIQGFREESLGEAV